MATSHSATVTLRNGMAFDAVSGSGHMAVLDAADDVGGANLGFRPMEMLLLGLGGCTAMDVISILRKMRQQIDDYQVLVEGDRAEEHPKLFTDIEVVHVVKGKNVSEEMVRKAIELSATRYCPAQAMMVKTARITNRYRIVDTESEEEITGSLDLPAAK